MKSEYRYRYTKSKGGSDRYGPCEVCRKKVHGNMYHQIEERKYVRPDGSTGWTQHECHSRFGHKTCLNKKER